MTTVTEAPTDDAPTCDTCQQPLTDWRDLAAWQASAPLTLERPVGKAPKPGSKRKQRTQAVIIAHHATCRRCLRAKAERILRGTTYARTADGRPVLAALVGTVRRNPTTGCYEEYDRAREYAQHAGLDGSPAARRTRHQSGLLAAMKPHRMRGCAKADPKPAAPPERLPAVQRQAIMERQRAFLQPFVERQARRAYRAA